MPSIKPWQLPSHRVTYPTRSFPLLPTLFPTLFPPLRLQPAFRELEADASAKCCMALTGTGNRAFSAGVDLTDPLDSIAIHLTMP